MKKSAFLFSGAALLLATAMPAAAAPLFFSYTPTTVGSQSFSFNVDSNPVPVNPTAFDFSTVVQNLTIGGVAQTGSNSVTFYDEFSGGGLFNALTSGFLGPQLYSGVGSAPTLLTGSFELTGGFGGSAGTLTVTSVAAAIPEPGTWAMMVLGFGLAGAAMRRRTIAARVTYAA